MSGEGTYAPKSPDLSSFYSAGPTPPAEPEREPQQLFLSQQSQPNFSHLQQPPARPYFPSSHQQHQPHAPGQQSQHYQVTTPPQTLAQARPIDNPQTSQAPGLGVSVVGYSPIAQHEYYHPRAASYPTTAYSQPGTGYTATHPPPPEQQQQQAPFYQPPYRASSLQFGYSQPHQFPPHLTAAQAPPPARPQQPYDYLEPTAAEGNTPYFPNPPSDSHPSTMPPRRAAAAAAAAAVAAQTASSDDAGPASASPAAGVAAASSAGAIEAAPVKTKFPTARIKRIMQADEEVGKVAQQTPIAVGKALEMFMVAMVTKSAEVARQRNSKRVSAQMLKQVVESDDQWDFLRDIVSKVEGEEKGGKGRGGDSQGGKVKAESETDEEGASGGGGGGGGDAGGAGAAGAKRKRGGGRKKKVQ